jgi:ubiquinone/menaquinone biosynthesis C-methylase UbiE
MVLDPRMILHLGNEDSVELWERLAAWYDRKQGNEGDLWHRSLIDPCLLKVLGEVKEQRALDLGCGNGYVSRILARRGAEVTGIDVSFPIVQLAKEREMRMPLGVKYYTVDAANLRMLEDEDFDVVVSNMSLMDIQDGVGAIHEVARVLKGKGRFVFSLSHPCFDTGRSSRWILETVGPTKTVWRKISRYREEHDSRILWRVGTNEIHETIHYHRSLSWYFRTLRSAGFVVTTFEEPEPTEEFMAEEPQGPWIADIPLHCVVEACKMENTV